ncbi:MAG: SWIM zinc finger family protein [Panacibacter sp.]
MLTLENFEEQVSPVILKRGIQYFKDGTVTDLEESKKNIWQAEVEGSETYEVEITLSAGGKINESFCDCPYDDGICKHTVAVLFAIKDELQKADTKQKKPGAKNSFENFLHKISLPEYQHFVLHHASKDKDFKTEFELYFSDKDAGIDVEKKYAALIQKIINKHSDRGYIDYRSTSRLAGDIGKLYITATQLIKKNNFSDAFVLSKSLLKAMMEVSTSCDDSNGYIGGTIDDAVSLLETIAGSDKAATALKEQIFFFLQTELGDKIYFDYGDYGYEMFGVFQKLAIQLNNAETFLRFIDAQLAKLTGEYDAYRKDFFNREKIEFLKAIGKTSEAEKLTEQNLNITEVRQDEVNKAIAKKDYKLAKQLIKDGIKVAEDKKHPGTVSQWQKELLRIAVIEKDIETVRHYTKYFAFDGWSDKEYYNQWKNTYHASEWTAVIEAVIDEKIKAITTSHEKNKGKSWQPANPPLLPDLAPIYIEEHYWDRLLALVQKEKGLGTILKYHEYLAKRYPADLLKLYIPAFEYEDTRASQRSEYATLASNMKRVIKDIPEGKAEITAITQNLIAKYPRRPAMIDELKKIL